MNQPTVREPEILMTAAEARAATDELRREIAAVDRHESAALEIMARIYDRRGWAALGFDSWRDWAAANFAKSTSWAYRQLARIDVVGVLVANGEIKGLLDLPESHARELESMLDDPKRLVKVYHDWRTVRGVPKTAAGLRLVKEATPSFLPRRPAPLPIARSIPPPPPVAPPMPSALPAPRYLNPVPSGPTTVVEDATRSPEDREQLAEARRLIESLDSIGHRVAAHPWAGTLALLGEAEREQVRAAVDVMDRALTILGPALTLFE